ncbi:MAG: hypothetical protein IKU42_08960 [Oscillospiraceae bacterium]|nr:hypothetical protein [Oscillospiraceae bacterium]
MKKKILFGVAFGIAAASAVAVTVNKISKELKNESDEEVFYSPMEDNRVKVSYGSSETAKGLTCIKIKVGDDLDDDSCKLVVLAKKDAALSYEWLDNEHFRLLIGNEKYKQCCDVTFDGGNINAQYYISKT